MPDTGNRTRHLVSHKGATIDARFRFDRVDRCSCPSVDCWALPHGGTHWRKRKARRAGNTKTPIGCVVIHVALSRIGLAPVVLMRSNVLSFGEVSGARILGRIQVAHFAQDPVGW